VRILYRVQSVAGRETPLARLLLSLPAAREVILDPDAATDPNPWRGYRRCLQNLGDASHVLVVQDDAIGCRNLEAAVERIARKRPDTLTSLCVCGLSGRSSREFRRAQKEGRAWVAIDTRPALHVIALLWPAPLAREFLAWAVENEARLPGYRGVPRSDDAVVGAFVRLTRKQVWATVPSLFQHPDDQVAVAGHRKHAWGKDPGRVAISWIGPDADPLELALT
jgi:hypothetical protein